MRADGRCSQTKTAPRMLQALLKRRALPKAESQRFSMAISCDIFGFVGLAPAIDSRREQVEHPCLI